MNIENAIKYLKQSIIDEVELVCEEEHNEALEVAIKALEDKSGCKWIPVSERLPSDEEINKYISIHPNYRQFLCTVKFADYEPQTRLIYFEESGWLYMGEDYNKHVIAWKPLPEAYRD